MGWIDVFIRRPVLTWMLTLSLVVFGVLGFSRLGVDQYPKMEIPRVNVTAIMEGASPEVMEEDVTEILEEQLNTIEGVKKLTSKSKQGQSSISIEFEIGEEFVVVKLDPTGKHAYQPVKVREFAAQSGSAVVETNGRSYEICSSWHLGAPRMRGTVDGRSFMAQVERGANKNPLALRVQHNGSRLDTLVFTPRTAELFALMPFKAPPDMSRFLLSPMPGLLVDVAVQPGQKVQAGERLAVIEAMKMENVLFASADGVVGKVLAGKGESLAVDQPILEFE